MGIWPFSSSTQSTGPTSPPSSDGGLIAPSRSSRQQCYIARDTFFTCLDAHSILDAVDPKSEGGKEARRKCGEEVAEFERACSATWAKYFKEKRVMEYNRDRTIDKIKREDEEKVKELKGSKTAGGGS
ncbi:hypothetical protein FQN54_009405 [Arachnomyces sp. PD_36]|nr:hypothetical protein FQN54_009405 [Arachnomyces sp. PD_36]